MGSPEKSDGSCTLAMTVVSGRSREAASWVSAAVLPIPGSPQSSTGRSAETARVSASSWMSGRGSVVVSRSRLINASATASWETGAESVDMGAESVDTGAGATDGAFVSMSDHLRVCERANVQRWVRR